MTNGTRIPKNIVSVQTLMGPTGLIHYMRFRHAESEKRREAERLAEEVRKKAIYSGANLPYRSLDDEWFSLEES